MAECHRLRIVDRAVRLAIAALVAGCFLNAQLGGPAIDIAGSETLLGMFAAMAAVAVIYAPSRRNVPKLAVSGAMVADLTAYALVFGVASYVAASWNFPLVDAKLAAAEQAIGFSWTGYRAFTEANPVFNWALKIGYYSMMPQFGLLALLLCWRGDIVPLRLLLNGFAICAICAILLSGLFPAIGAFPHYGLLTPGQADTGTIPAIVVVPYEQMLFIRSGAMRVISLLTVDGIVTFPSFHTMSAVVFAASAWHIGWLRWPALVLNALLIAATPSIGGHFIVDTIFGFAAALAIVFAMRAYVSAGSSAGVLAPATA